MKIYLILGESNPKWIEPLVKMIQGMGAEVVLKTVDKSVVQNLKLNLHFSFATYFRVLAGLLISEPKAIYLDSDTLVNGSLEELFNIDLEDFPLAAVFDPKIQDYERLHLDSVDGYFNSGVMLVNLEQWRKIDLGKMVLDFIKENPEKILFADQCGFNAVLKGNWMRLQPKWNTQSFILEKDAHTECLKFFSSDEINEANKNPKIIHFTGVQKPWNLGCKHPFKSLFWKYLRSSPFKRNLPLDFSVLNFVKSLFPISFKKYYWRKLKEKEFELANNSNS